MCAARRRILLLLVMVFINGLNGGLVHAEGVATDWPPSITANIGTLQVRLESRSFWTLYRIDFKGERLGIDHWGSHYGSVARFPDVGFIGSGHTENENEEVLSLALLIDGVPVTTPSPSISGTSLRLTKHSRIRSLHLETVVELRGGEIVEDVRISSNEDTALSLIYHFMHPWTTSMSEYVGELKDGSLVRGVFDGDKKQEIDQPTRWSAVFDGTRELGVLTVVLEAPEQGWRTRYWDVSDRYRKHYFTTMIDETMAKDRSYHYRILTIPFAADKKTWSKEAEVLATGALAGVEALKGEP